MNIDFSTLTLILCVCQAAQRCEQEFDGGAARRHQWQVEIRNQYVYGFVHRRRRCRCRGGVAQGEDAFKTEMRAVTVQNCLLTRGDIHVRWHIFG